MINNMQPNYLSKMLTNGFKTLLTQNFNLTSSQY